MLWVTEHTAVSAYAHSAKSSGPWIQYEAGARRGLDSKVGVEASAARWAHRRRWLSIALR
jgi:hypothetical protein